MDFIAEEARTYFPAIRSSLGMGRFALFGHGVGGAMAVTIAASPGENCEAVVTESAADTFRIGRDKEEVLRLTAAFLEKW